MTERTLLKNGWRRSPIGDHWFLDLVFDGGHHFMCVERLIWHPESRILRKITKKQLNKQETL
jgi:hypothetical protein